jgi:GrpB-like predicted nucleotidyltransferase (UPF0157 family)
LHLVPTANRRWIEAIAFRDYLRAHPHIASEYAQLKRDLATQYRTDREAYTVAKQPFIERVLNRALPHGSHP